MKTPQEILEGKPNKRGSSIGALPHYHYNVVIKAMREYAEQYQQDNADLIIKAIEYGYQIRVNNRPINSGIDWKNEFLTSLNKQDK